MFSFLATHSTQWWWCGVDAPQKEIGRRHEQKIYLWKYRSFFRNEKRTRSSAQFVTTHNSCSNYQHECLWMDGCLCVLYSHILLGFSFHFKEDSFIVCERESGLGFLHAKVHARAHAFIIIFSSCPDNLAVNAKWMYAISHLLHSFNQGHPPAPHFSPAPGIKV